MIIRLVGGMSSGLDLSTGEEGCCFLVLNPPCFSAPMNISHSALGGERLLELGGELSAFSFPV